MKKALCVIAMILCLSQAGFSQEKGTYKQTLTKLMEVTGSMDTYKLVIKNLVGMYKSQSTDVAAEFWTKFEEKLSTSASTKLVDMMVPIYQKYVSEADLKSVIAFYETPAGKRFVGKNPEIVAESMQVGQKWGAEIGAELQAALEDSKESAER